MVDLHKKKKENIIVDRFLFNKVAKSGFVTPSSILERIEKSGLELTDPRLSSTVKKLKNLPSSLKLNAMKMETLIRENSGLLHRALNGDLAVSQWKDFERGILEIIEEVRPIQDGQNATYIPALKEVDSNLFAVSICTVDGQRLDIGDINHKFCLQSCSKAISYLAAAAKRGTDFVHKYVGREPSGLCFNSLNLKKVENEDGSIKYIPHNSMINAGAIMSCSIIREDEVNEDDSINEIREIIAKLTGSKEVGINNYVYESEMETADRNRCLTYMMREYKSFPRENEDVEKLLKFYCKMCAIEATPREASVIAASLANDGTCPLTNEAIFSPLDVRNCLSQMLSCGMYDYSGEWAFRIGLPAKSGVSGCILIVIPEKMGIAVFSPRLDHMGNSVRGIAFSERLVRRFSVHHLDNLRAKGARIEPPIPRVEASQSRQHRQHITDLLMAASNGDVDDIRRLVSIDVDPFEPGVDQRTALHLAACENRLKVLNLLLKIAKDDRKPMDKVFVKDLFQNTPLDDAKREGNEEAVRIITDFITMTYGELSMSKLG